MSRPTPPAQSKYRIERYYKLFVIQRLTEIEIKSNDIFERLLYGKSRKEFKYENISEVFSSLNEAKFELEKIMLETEVKYYYFD